MQEGKGEQAVNYPPNTQRWQRGDIVIHDKDAKRPEMLMVVQGYHRYTGECRTTYLHPDYLQCMQKRYYNDIQYLHDPARFGIEVPGK